VGATFHSPLLCWRFLVGYACPHASRTCWSPQPCLGPSPGPSEDTITLVAEAFESLLEGSPNFNPMSLRFLTLGHACAGGTLSMITMAKPCWQNSWVSNPTPHASFWNPGASLPASRQQPRSATCTQEVCTSAWRRAWLNECVPGDKPPPGRRCCSPVMVAVTQQR